MAVPKSIPETTKTLIREYLRYDHDMGCVVWQKAPDKKIKAGDPIRDCVSMSVDGVRIWYHRLVWFLAYGEFPKFGIRRKNGDHGDNRLENLLLMSTNEGTEPVGNTSPEAVEKLYETLFDLQDFAARGIGISTDTRKELWPVLYPPDPIIEDDRPIKFRLWGLTAYE